MALRSINLTALTRLRRKSARSSNPPPEKVGEESFKSLESEKWAMGERELDAWMTPQPKPMLPSLHQTSTPPSFSPKSATHRSNSHAFATFQRKVGVRHCQIIARKTLPSLKFATINIDLNQAEGHNLLPKAIRLLISNKLDKVNSVEASIIWMGGRVV
jgi:hypothetical protein